MTAGSDVPMLEARDVARAFDGAPVLRGVDLDVARGEIVCLLGPSGCGKTTLLRIIAGLESLDAGDVLVDGQSIVGVPVHERGFGLMFQDFALFPHLNVRDNVLFGLRLRAVPRRRRQERLHEVLALVGLTGFETRDVTALSGGEQQRVALARSLAPNPRLLMLDEPLGSLDASLRGRLLVELRAIIKRVGLTAIYVTHDQSEAYAVADRIAVMNAGRIEQTAAPETLYRSPATAFVARFLGLENIVSVLRQEGDCVHTPLGAFEVEGQPGALLLHPDGITLAPPDAPAALPARVRECTFQGDHYRLEVEHESGTLLEFNHPSGDHTPDIGDSVALAIAPQSVVPLPSP